MNVMIKPRQFTNSVMRKLEAQINCVVSKNAQGWWVITASDTDIPKILRTYNQLVDEQAA